MALALRFVVAVLFLAAGTMKFASRDSLRDSVESFQVLPPRLAQPIARMLVPTELVAGALLLLGVLPGLMLRVLGTLLLLFAVAVAVNLARARVIDCGCWGNHATPISWGLASRNSALAVAAWLASFRQPLGVSIFDPWARGPVLTASTMVACMLLPALGLIGSRLAIVVARAPRPAFTGGRR